MLWYNFHFNSWHSLRQLVSISNFGGRSTRSCPSVEDSEILETYPLLCTDTWIPIQGKSAAGKLRLHEAKAYLLLKDLAGGEVAQREFDPSRLQEEIDYIRNGGELEFLQQ